MKSRKFQYFFVFVDSKSNDFVAKQQSMDLTAVSIKSSRKQTQLGLIHPHRGDP